MTVTVGILGKTGLCKLCWVSVVVKHKERKETVNCVDLLWMLEALGKKGCC